MTIFNDHLIFEEKPRIAALFTSTDPITYALSLLKQTEDKAAVDKGFQMLLDLADEGDMTAAAYVGYASQFKHLGHYDLERCREYLERSALEGDPMGMYFLGEMLMKGEPPFDEDKVRGKWLLENADCEEAKQFLEDWYQEEMTMTDAGKMMVKSGIKLSLLDLWEKIRKRR